jgi:hypothetical protein
MAAKFITLLVALGLMAGQVAAQEYSDEEYVPNNRIMVAARGSCEHAAQQAIALTGGELLSVRPARNGRPICAVTVLVINAKGRPKKVRLRIPMDM